MQNGPLVDILQLPQSSAVVQSRGIALLATYADLQPWPQNSSGRGRGDFAPHLYVPPLVTDFTSEPVSRVYVDTPLVGDIAQTRPPEPMDEDERPATGPP